MSSLFEIHDRIRRLRGVYSFFGDAAAQCGAELANAPGPGIDERTREEWARLISDARDFMSDAEGWAPLPDDDGDIAEPVFAEFAKPFKPRSMVSNVRRRTTRGQRAAAIRGRQSQCEEQSYGHRR